jgi:hypothetical protein
MKAAAAMFAGSPVLHDRAAPILAREVKQVAVEVARQLTAPDAPSRLNCVFCTEDIESAKAFRDRFRNGESIYEVEVEDTVSTHTGNYDALTDGRRLICDR